MSLSTSLTLPKFGNTSPSSLIKSASTLQNELNTYQDTVQRLQFENNPSDSNLQSYLNYLGGRMNVLNATGSITNATKALELQQTGVSAVSKNTSFNIQNESIQVLTGNATNTDKLNYIMSAYQRAAGIGDVTLAQSLESQAYGLSQTIQYEQQVSAQNAITVNNANATAIKAGYTNAIDAVKSGLTDVYTQLQNGGETRVQGALKDFTAKFGDLYTQLTGEKLPTGAQVSLGSITQAYFNAEYQYNLKAAAAIQPYSTTDAQTFTQNAQDIVSGATKISVPGVGNMNVYQANTWAASPNLYRVVTNADGTNSLTQNAITHYEMQNGQVIPISNGEAGTAYGILNNKSVNGQTNTVKTNLLGNNGNGGLLQKLNLNLVSNNNGNVTVQLTNQALKELHLTNTDLRSGDQITLIPQANGGLQFTQNGKIYNLAVDAKNLVGVNVTDSTGKSSFIGGQYGFNQQVNTMVSNATVQQLQQKAQQTIALAAQTAISNQQKQAQLLTASSANFAIQHGLTASNGTQPTMSQRAGGGYNFMYNGAAISAAKYSELTGTPFRTLLQQMATTGDVGAKTALGFVGNDYKFDTGKVTSYQNAGTYNALTWGAGVPTNTGTAPASLLGNGAQLKY
jgi:hypothetical protein